MGNQKFWDQARLAWGDREIADADVVRLSKLPCLGCAHAYAAVQAPLFVHPCVCGEWHRVCAVCVIREKLIVGGPTPGSTMGRFGLLEKCPYPIRVAREVMGEVEVVKHHPTPRVAPTLKQWEELTKGEPMAVPDLEVRVTRLH